MHELGVTQSLLDIAVRHAQNAGATRVNQLNIVVGELSSIVDDSVQFYWDMISKGTIAERAKLIFKRLPALITCQDCGAEFRMNPENFFCPECGSSHILVTSGEDFFLESIDVDFAEDANTAGNAPDPGSNQPGHS